MNILLVLPDQHRGDFVGHAGRHPVRTPQIDRLAQRGVTFARAWTPSPLCGPARACLALGVDYDLSPVRSNAGNLPVDAPNLFKHLRSAGYRTATCGKLDLLKQKMDWGLDGRHVVGGVSRLDELGFSDGLDSAGKHDAVIAHARGLPEPYLAYLKEHGLADAHAADFAKRRLDIPTTSLAEMRADEDRLIESYANTAPTPLPDHGYCDNWIGRTALDLLDDLRGDAPWFLQVNFCGPHEPLDVTSAMIEPWRDVNFSLPYARANRDAAQQQTIRRRYAAMIECVDGWLGQFTQMLKQTHQSENTLIVYASDHGEMLGDRNLWAKHVPFEPSVHVPLIVAGPGVVGGRVVASPASLLDILPTAFDLAGIEAPAGDGVSMRSVLGATAQRHRAHVTTGLGPWRAITDGRYKLTVGYDESMTMGDLEQGPRCDLATAPARLVDLIADPREAHDLGGAMPDRRDALRQALIEAVS